MSVKLELTPMHVIDVIDSDTIDYYAMGKKDDIVESNRELFSNGQEFVYDNYYFCFINVKESDFDLTFLHPYRASVSRHQWKYKFGCQDSNGKLYWFFNGFARANTREMAIDIWKHLSMYCENLNLKPFIIKR